MFKKIKIKLNSSKPEKSKISSLKTVFGKIRYLDFILENNNNESGYINESLEEKEKESINQIYKNQKLVAVHKDHKELTEYINKIFEQQEKERLVRWIVNSIRESLDLDEVLEKTVEQIGRLLYVDRCFVALYDRNTEKFCVKNEFRINENIPSIFNFNDHLLSELSELPKSWHEELFINKNPLIINNCEEAAIEEDLSEKNKIFIGASKLKSFIILPLVHQGEILGALSVSQINYKRKWENNHIEILHDTGSQIAIAIRQALLYTKVQETTKLKSAFLANMSHEFRTPLNAIIGFSDMLLSENFGDLNEKQKKFLENIFISGSHLLSLVNDILDHSKIESGNINLNYEFFDANLAISETVSILKDISTKKNISIKENLAENIIINADIIRFKQIMYNLLNNAIKFTEDDGEILIDSVFYNNNLKIEIKDTGIGISAKDKNKIFQKFTQLDSSYTKKQEGSGLGLALTKKLVEMHKGQIDFDSEKGKGSKFWFVLPNAKQVGLNSK